MAYYSFLCWFVWRFLTALLAHINWVTAIYLKCIYFTYWKSYGKLPALWVKRFYHLDLLWFWMHLFLCICFESLRPENYLLVWFNLVKKKCTTHKNKSFKVSKYPKHFERRHFSKYITAHTTGSSPNQKGS